MASEAMASQADNVGIVIDVRKLSNYVAQLENNGAGGDGMGHGQSVSNFA